MKFYMHTKKSYIQTLMYWWNISFVFMSVYVSLCLYVYNMEVSIYLSRLIKSFQDGFLERLSSAEFVSLCRDIEVFVTDTGEMLTG